MLNKYHQIFKERLGLSGRKERQILEQNIEIFLLKASQDCRTTPNTILSRLFNEAGTCVSDFSEEQKNILQELLLPLAKEICEKRIPVKYSEDIMDRFFRVSGSFRSNS